MCGILDTNSVSEVFGSSQTRAGAMFFTWIHTGRGCLVVGGKLLRELSQSSQAIRDWMREARRAGRLRIERSERVEERTDELLSEGVCVSDDPHTIALAQISDTRLLYTEDQKLIADFTNSSLINNPSGKVVPRGTTANAHRQRRRLLDGTECVRHK